MNSKVIILFLLSYFNSERCVLDYFLAIKSVLGQYLTCLYTRAVGL
ncbi:hypothetical protein ALT1000_170067 [Alteromonas macleodii]